mmetsp:Transcript_1499/g.2033  ORF Transcript_1499/g.2033 Transcript_1499/m.2033 type:complete len:127 (+) Transcript_1499:31-411(+)
MAKKKTPNAATIQVHCMALAHDNDALNHIHGTVDLIVASSVMNFIPQKDLHRTMKVLGDMLRDGGLFVHSDWPKAKDDDDDGFTEASAKELYAMGGLSCKSTEVTKFHMANDEEASVFFGIAEKKK